MDAHLPPSLKCQTLFVRVEERTEGIALPDTIHTGECVGGNTVAVYE